MNPYEPPSETPASNKVGYAMKFLHLVVNSIFFVLGVLSFELLGKDPTNGFLLSLLRNLAF